MITSHEIRHRCPLPLLQQLLLPTIKLIAIHLLFSLSFSFLLSSLFQFHSTSDAPSGACMNDTYITLHRILIMTQHGASMHEWIKMILLHPPLHSRFRNPKSQSANWILTSSFYSELSLSLSLILKFAMAQVTQASGATVVNETRGDRMERMKEKIEREVGIWILSSPMILSSLFTFSDPLIVMQNDSKWEKEKDWRDSSGEREREGYLNLSQLTLVRVETDIFESHKKFFLPSLSLFCLLRSSCHEMSSGNTLGLCSIKKTFSLNLIL